MYEYKVERIHALSVKSSPGVSLGIDLLLNDWHKLDRWEPILLAPAGDEGDFIVVLRRERESR